MKHVANFKSKETGIRLASASGETKSIADDLIPATLASIPVIVLVFVLGLSDQPALTHAILQDGKPLSLITPLAPLFLPTIAVVFVYMAKRRGWMKWVTHKTNSVALTLGIGLSAFVPLNYLLLQAAATMITLSVILGRHRRWGRARKIVVVALQLALVAVLIASVSAWKVSQLDYFSRVATGRVLEGLSRINVIDGQGERSLLIIGVVGNNYAVVATSGYPSRIEHVHPSVIANGKPCQVLPNWNQRSFASIVSLVSETNLGTPNCL